MQAKKTKSRKDKNGTKEAIVPAVLWCRIAKDGTHVLARVGGSGSSLELISFWTISRYFPHMEKLWKKKTKDSQGCTISKYWPYMEKMWKTVSVGQFFRYWPYMEKMSKETANKQY